MSRERQVRDLLARVAREHVRVFPISNWTELDVWQYIEREKLAVPSIYYAHRRKVVRKNGFLFIEKNEGKGEELSVRFRTVGDISSRFRIWGSFALSPAAAWMTARAR